MKRAALIAIIAAVVLVVCIGATAYAANRWVDEFKATTAAGKASAVAGISSLAALDATGAASHFAKATDSFEHAEQLMGPAWARGVVGVVPWARRQFAAVEDLVAIGQAGATVGTEIAAVMRIEPSPSAADSRSGNDPVLASGQKHVLAAFAAMNDAAERAKRLNEDGLVGPVAGQVRAVNTLLREKVPFLDRIGPLYQLTNKLLPTEQRFLVASNSSAELRPTGGFIGTYGVLVVGPSGVEVETYENVYSLPNPPGRVPMPPGATMARDFQFRDANWWLDFPTSAQAMLEFWEDAGQPPVDGVIAVDVIGISRVLGVLGPIELAKFSETFSEENLLQRLTYYVEVASGGGDDKKDVVAALATALEKRARDADPQELAKTLMALSAAADEKHIQLYLIDPEAQAAAAELGWSGAIAPPEGTTDILGVSNAMNIPSKVNFSMRKRIDYEVGLKPDGSAETTLALGYANKGRMVIPERGVFGNYLRVYRAPGTQIEPDDISPAETGTVDIDLPMAVREFKVRRGQSRTETIVTRIPNAWRTGPAAGTPSYRLYIVRQADLEDVPTTVSISPPAGWRVTTVAAREVASGKTVPVSKHDGLARLSVPLKADTVLDVGLSRD